MRFLFAALALAVVAGAQSSAPLSFEAASIRPEELPEPGRNRANRVEGGRIDWQFATLRYAIGFAYGVKDYQIAGSGWLAQDRWQIQAKAPDARPATSSPR